MDKKYTKALEFVKKKHANRFYANKVPQWHHLARVSERLKSLLNHYKEGTPKQRGTIVIASLGHDIIEDTDATEKELLKIFEKNEHSLIIGATNEWGDEDVTPYIKKVTKGPEEVRLIKLADLSDNITAVVYTLKVLGSTWTKEYFLPTVTPMKEAILKTSFKTYKKTAKHLKENILCMYDLLEKELKRISDLEKSSK